MIHVCTNFAAETFIIASIMKDFPFGFSGMRSGEDRTEQKEVARVSKPKCVLEALEYIVELVEGSNLNTDFLEQAKHHIRYAARKLKLNETQVILLAIFIDKSEDCAIRLSEVASYAGCRTTRILRLSMQVDILEEKGYLVCSRSRRSQTYRVPAEVIESIKNNMPYEPKPLKANNLGSFFDAFNTLMRSKNDDELTYSSLVDQTNILLEQIADNHFARTLRSYNMDDSEKILFIFMAHLFIENSDDRIGFSDIENLYDNDEIPAWIKGRFRSRSLHLFEKKLIENVNEDGLARGDCFKLTDFAKTELLGELKPSTIGRSQADLLKHDSFAAKQLIYNPAEDRQVSELTSILMPDRFNEVQTRLEKAGMRKGFCCLFYGDPGTGKTETVYQLARLTGRDIMRVDVDKVKSCWVGESEKNIKALFDRYRNICKNAELAPILLFNEADAVLGVRMEGASRAVDKMENSIQNIILQEMENLEGIMIATTNLTTNLDKAFERRFLYKVRYSRPSTEARAKIWQTMLKGLTADDARTLAAEADLSGSEIENIVRKHTVATILSGDEIINLAELRKLCQTERLASPRSKIGF